MRTNNSALPLAHLFAAALVAILLSIAFPQTTIAAEAATTASTSAASATATATELLTTETAVRRLVEKYADRLARSRYMEQGEGELVSCPGWEKFPVRKYHYSVRDKATSSTKQATVLLLDAPTEKIARWIVTACSEARGGEIWTNDTHKMFEHILGQSGGQFPVAGVVYEDILPADGINEIFCFRDGVTVAVEGVPHRGTAPMDDAQLSASLTGRVTKVYRYARIQSTSPSEYKAAGGQLDVGTDDDRKPAWLDASRESYQSAWNSDRNPLMSAWARAHLK